MKLFFKRLFKTHEITGFYQSWDHSEQIYGKRKFSEKYMEWSKNFKSRFLAEASPTENIYVDHECKHPLTMWIKSH